MILLAQSKDLAYEDLEVFQKPRVKARPRQGMVALFTLACAVVVAVSLASVYQKTAIVAATYELQDWEARLQQAKEENVRLNLTMSNLRSLDRIETVARTKLGMVSPAKVEFLVLEQPQTMVASSEATATELNLPGKVLGLVSEVIQVLLPRVDRAEAGSIGR